MKQLGSLIVVCQLVNLALMRTQQLLRNEMDHVEDGGTTPVLLRTIDHLNSAHEQLLQAIISRQHRESWP